MSCNNITVGDKCQIRIKTQPGKCFCNGIFSFELNNRRFGGIYLMTQRRKPLISVAGRAEIRRTCTATGHNNLF